MSLAMVYTDYLYGGTPSTVFAWHVEDCHLYSANYLIDGAGTVRHMVPAYYINNFFKKQKGKQIPSQYGNSPRAEIDKAYRPFLLKSRGYTSPVLHWLRTRPISWTRPVGEGRLQMLQLYLGEEGYDYHLAWCISFGYQHWSEIEWGG